MTRIAIKRACFGWSTIGVASATVGLFSFWVVSATSTRTDFLISWDIESGATWKEVSAKNGSFTAKCRLNGVDEFDFLKKPGVMEPTARFFSWDIPGIALRKIDGVGYGCWYARISLLIPTLILALLTVGCFGLYRRALRKWQAELVKAKSSAVS